MVDYFEKTFYFAHSAGGGGDFFKKIFGLRRWKEGVYIKAYSECADNVARQKNEVSACL